MLHNANPKRNIGCAKRGEPSEAKSDKLINVVHMSTTFAPSLTTAVLFICLGSHDCYGKKGLHLPMDEKKNWSKFRVVLTKEMQGGNITVFRPQGN